MLYESVAQLIGNTPLLLANKFAKMHGVKARLAVKLECFNPAGSVKDRVAENMISSAERNGTLKKGATVIEPTSGNTGIGLAAVCAAKGYKLIVTMPDTMSEERRKLIRAYGAQIVLTDGKKGMTGAIEKAEEIRRNTPDSLIAGQFVNIANPLAHKASTGREIWNDTNGNIDIFVAGVGTGGTITGVGEFLKEQNPKIEIVAVEPEGSPVLSKNRAGVHKIQGIGAGFIPQILNTKIYDEIVAVSDGDAIARAREFAKAEGLLVGISSGAALQAAAELAKRKKNENKTIVALLPDSGERYLSTELYEE